MKTLSEFLQGLGPFIFVYVIVGCGFFVGLLDRWFIIQEKKRAEAQKRAMHRADEIKRTFKKLKGANTWDAYNEHLKSK
jgi:hypothetical protein